MESLPLKNLKSGGTLIRKANAAKRQRLRNQKTRYYEKAYLFLIFTIHTHSCVTSSACERKYPQKQSDSVSMVSNTVTVIRDTTIYVKIPGDTVFQSLPSDQISTLKTGIASSTAWVQDGRLNHRLQQDDTIIPSTIKGALTRTVSQTGKVSLLKRVEYINKLSGWQVFQIYCGRLGLLLTVLCIIRVLVSNRIRRKVI